MDPDLLNFRPDFQPCALPSRSARCLQGGKKSLSVAITGELYTFDLMEIRVWKEPVVLQGQKNFFLLHCLLLIVKVRLSQGKMAKKVSQSFDTGDAWVLTATLWFWIRFH